MSYSWTTAAGGPSAAILGSGTATPVVEFGGGFGSYSFQLTVTDSAGKTASDTVTVLYAGR